MIESISITNFKSLENVRLRLGPLNLFIGTNASGKSNFLEALRVIQGIGYGFSISEILDGKPRSASSAVWQQIRGGSARSAFEGRVASGVRAEKQTVQISVGLSLPGVCAQPLEYSIAFNPRSGRVVGEFLNLDYQPLFQFMFSGPHSLQESTASYKRAGESGSRGEMIQVNRSHPVLQQLAVNPRCSPEHVALMQACLKSLGDMQRLDPSPAVLREYSENPSAKRMGERGENFAAVVSTILDLKSQRRAYEAWLKQLTPAELDQVKILRGALREPLFALTLGKQEFPAPVLSDGTLRFAALAAAFFQPDLPSVIMIEEVENGIHPSRLRLLMELLKSQTRTAEPQVFATTHSPAALSWMQEEDYATVFHCARNEDTGASIIRPLSKVPRFADIIKKQSAGDLFAEGWLEAAL